MSLFRIGVNGNEYQRAIAEVGRLRKVYATEKAAHGKTKSERDALERRVNEVADSPQTGIAVRGCAECGCTAPDSPAFFGSAANDPGGSKCAACSRGLFHDAGIRHYSASCSRCAAEGFTAEVRDGVILKWMTE